MWQTGVRMKLAKVGISFIVFLFIYSFIGLLIDMLLNNDYSAMTYAIRRFIQFLLFAGYLIFVIRSNQINLRYTVKVPPLLGYIIVTFAFIILYESTVDIFIKQFFSTSALSQARDSSLEELFKYPLALFIQTCISAPMLEEVLIRGVMYEILREKISVKWSIIICTAFFCILHFDISNILFYIMLGLILSYVYVESNSILHCIILHMCINAFSVCTYYISFNPNQLTVIISMIVSLLIVLGTIAYSIKKRKQ